jgi:hypothetical protein
MRRARRADATIGMGGRPAPLSILLVQQRDQAGDAATAGGNAAAVIGPIRPALLKSPVTFAMT